MSHYEALTGLSHYTDQSGLNFLFEMAKAPSIFIRVPVLPFPGGQHNPQGGV